SPRPRQALDQRLHDLEGSPCPLAHPSAAEHRPEYVSLVRSLLDEILETVDHALHERLPQLAGGDSQRGIEMDPIPTGRHAVLAGGDESRARLESEGSRASGHGRRAAEEAHAHSWTLLQVA